MTMLQNSNRRFGARKGVLRADKGVNSANKAVLAPVFAPNVTIYCVRGMGARKGAAVRIKFCSVRIKFSHLNFNCFYYELFVCYLNVFLSVSSQLVSLRQDCLTRILYL